MRGVDLQKQKLKSSKIERDFCLLHVRLLKLNEPFLDVDIVEIGEHLE